MNVLVKFIEHIPDNYQGGSGITVNRSTICEVDDQTRLFDLKYKIQHWLDMEQMGSPIFAGQRKEKILITSIEIF